MGTTLLWTLHLSFSLLLPAAALAWSHGCSAAARRVLAALALVPLVVLQALLVWKTASLRFGSGVVHAPWLAAGSLLVLHVAGSTALILRARRGAGAAAWPAGALALCASVALALDVSTLRNLELAARLRVSDLRLEEECIAWRECSPRPAPGDDAREDYLAVCKVLEERLGAELRDWCEIVQGERALDDAGPELRATLGTVAAELETVRAATRRAACWFEPEELPDGIEMPVGPLLRIADGWRWRRTCSPPTAGLEQRSRTSTRSSSSRATWRRRRCSSTPCSRA